MITKYITAPTARGNVGVSYESHRWAIAQAEAMDAAGCSDCVDCIACRDCVGCISCTACANCKECMNCMNCTRCARCTDCKKIGYRADCAEWLGKVA